jgi:hypothetical protein
MVAAAAEKSADAAGGCEKLSERLAVPPQEKFNNVALHTELRSIPSGAGNWPVWRTGGRVEKPPARRPGGKLKHAPPKNRTFEGLAGI